MIGYRWWALDPTAETELASWQQFFRSYVPSIALAAVALAAPPVASATGVSSLAAILLCGAHAVMTLLTTYLGATHPGPRTNNFAYTVNVITSTGVATAFPVLTGRPDSMLWLLLCVYSSLNATMLNFGPSIALLVASPLAALATIPIFLALGADPTWSFAGPVVAAAMSAMTYHFIASRTGLLQARRKAAEAQRAELQFRLAELERRHIARDLHDAVGSTLTLAALYGELVERHAEEPAVLRRLATNLRGEARQGLGDLRGVLDALAPEPVSFGGLGREIRELVRRLAATGSTLVDVDIVGEATFLIPADVRVATMRIVQEALQNIVRHARASNVTVRVTLAAALSIEIIDDGCGFVVGDTARGRGLAGMTDRATELRGSLAIESEPGRGTRLHATVPIVRDDRAPEARSKLVT